jgi:LacI family transcriptional regulator
MQPMQHRPTIHDVAREAGVAASTVSRAYNRPGRVSPETARKIFGAAELLGYRASSLAGSARPDPAKERRTVGLVIPDVTNPVFGPIIEGAYEAADEAGYLLILSHTDESAQVERATIEQGLAEVDGVVLAASRMSDSSIRMMAKQTALVLLNRAIPEVSCVVTDNARGARRAAEHLGELGHRVLGYLAGPEASWPDGMRWRGLREAGHELVLDVRRLGPNEPTVIAGFRAARQVADSRATAVVAYNDQMAIGLIKGLRQLGVDVPRDVSVVGFDNILFDEVVEPELTTVAAGLFDMGRTGMRLCIEVAAGNETSTVTHVLPVELITRASTGRCRTEALPDRDSRAGRSPEQAPARRQPA